MAVPLCDNEAPDCIPQDSAAPVGPGTGDPLHVGVGEQLDIDRMYDLMSDVIFTVVRILLFLVGLALLTASFEPWRRDLVSLTELA
jgi:hypothetical protein